MPVYIYDSDAFEKMVKIEGEDWARHQLRFGDCSFDAFYTAWKELSDEDRQVAVGTDTDWGIDVNGMGAIYGRDGWNRYTVRYSGEILMIRRVCSARSITLGETLGFRVLG